MSSLFNVKKLFSVKNWKRTGHFFAHPICFLFSQGKWNVNTLLFRKPWTSSHRWCRCKLSSLLVNAVVNWLRSCKCKIPVMRPRKKHCPERPFHVTCVDGVTGDRKGVGQANTKRKRNEKKFKAVVLITICNQTRLDFERDLKLGFYGMPTNII